MLCSLIDSFTATPAALLGAYPSLPLLGGVRQALLASLAAAVKVRSVGLLGAEHKLLANERLEGVMPSAEVVPRHLTGVPPSSTDLHLTLKEPALPLPPTRAGHGRRARRGCGGRRRGGGLPCRQRGAAAAVGPVAAAQPAVI